MAVKLPRENWPDDRLDELNRKVDVGFARVDERFEKGEGKIESGIKELRGEMNERFDKVDAKFEKIDTKFDALDAKFDKKFDWLIGILLVSVLGILAAVIGPDVL